VKPPTIREVVQAVEEYTCSPFSDWGFGFAEPALRYRAAYGLTAHRLGFSYPETQAPIGGSHTSAWQYVKRAFELESKDESFRLLVDACQSVAYRLADAREPISRPTTPSAEKRPQSDPAAPHGLMVSEKSEMKVPTPEDIAKIIAEVTGIPCHHWTGIQKGARNIDCRKVWIYLCRTWCGVLVPTLSKRMGIHIGGIYLSRWHRLDARQRIFADAGNIKLLARYRMPTGVFIPKGPKPYKRNPVL
jgi:hypothetical protein